MLKTIMSNCPKGFHLALKISEVTPISEAISVRKFCLSNSAKETAMNKTEQHHKTISPFEKYPKILLI